MRVAAYKWVRKAQEGATVPNCPDCGWTQDDTGEKHLEVGTTSGLESGIIDKVSLKHVGLYVHCYPHCSVNSLHLHIVDAEHLGPSYATMTFKNLEIDIVIEAFEREIKEATVLVQTDA